MKGRAYSLIGVCAMLLGLAACTTAPIDQGSSALDALKAATTATREAPSMRITLDGGSTTDVAVYQAPDYYWQKADSSGGPELLSIGSTVYFGVPNRPGKFWMVTRPGPHDALGGLLVPLLTATSATMADAIYSFTYPGGQGTATLNRGRIATMSLTQAPKFEVNFDYVAVAGRQPPAPEDILPGDGRLGATCRPDAIPSGPYACVDPSSSP